MEPTYVAELNQVRKVGLNAVDLAFSAPQPIPKAYKTIIDLLQHHHRKYAQKTVYTFLHNDGQAQSLSYAELYAKARQIAVHLQAQNLEQKRVLLLYPPGLAFIEAFLGCLLANVIAVPGYPPKGNRSIQRLETMAVDAEADLILAPQQTIAQFKSKSFESVLHHMVWEAHEALFTHEGSTWRKPDCHPDTIAFLQYTSGSTREPKGVITTHQSILYNQQMIQAALAHDAESRILGWAPHFHDQGLIGNILQPLYLGATCYLMSPIDFVQKPVRWLQAISDHNISTSGGPNFAFDLCVDKIDDNDLTGIDLSSWKVAFNGAEPIRIATLKAFTKRFKPYGFRDNTFYPIYGLAEAMVFSSGGQVSDRPKVKFVDVDDFRKGIVSVPADNNQDMAWVNCGNSHLDQRIRIVDPNTLKDIGVNQVGEIWISGPNVAAGYWNRESLTKDIFQAQIDGELNRTYLRTGDLGFLDAKQNLFVTGRRKDLIIVNGRNIYPQDLEVIIEDTDGAVIKNAVSCGQYQDDDRALVMAFVEIQRTALRKTDFDGLANRIHQALAESHEVSIDGIAFLKPMTIPKTSSGKIQRQRCIQQFANDELPIVLLWENTIIKSESVTKPSFSPMGDVVIMDEYERKCLDIIKSIVGKKDIRLTDNIGNLGANSLLAIQVLLKIEETFEISLAPQALGEMKSIKELAGTIKSIRIDTAIAHRPDDISRILDQIEMLDKIEDTTPEHKLAVEEVATIR